MALGKQAKTLSDAQQRSVISFLNSRPTASRDLLMFLLSVDAGLRAKEIALLDWSMITDAEGELTDAIRLQDRASKGKSGGVIYLSSRLRSALVTYRQQCLTSGVVLKSSRGNAMSAPVVTNWFWHLYRHLWSAPHHDTSF